MLSFLHRFFCGFFGLGFLRQPWYTYSTSFTSVSPSPLGKDFLKWMQEENNQKKSLKHNNRKIEGFCQFWKINIEIAQWKNMMLAVNTDSFMHNIFNFKQERVNASVGRPVETSYFVYFPISLKLYAKKYQGIILYPLVTQVWYINFITPPAWALRVLQCMLYVDSLYKL